MTKVQAFEVATASNNSQKPSNGETLITLVLDETGSMYSVAEATISSVNDYLGSQKSAPGVAKANLYKFSTAGGWRTSNGRTAFRTVFESKNVADVSDLKREDFNPDGGTNLYDAIGNAIKSVEAQLAGLDEVPNVLMAIVTDGGENASKEYKLADIKAMIADKEKEGWTFVYLGANQDAWQVGQSFGLSKGQTMTYDTGNMNQTMATLSAKTTAYRSMRASGAVADGTVARGFFDDDAS